MNERIKVLAEQTTSAVETRPGTGACEMEKYNEKFAELIIKDIFNVMNNKQTYNRCTYTTHDLDKAQCVVQEVIKCVNEHFGTKL